MGWDLFFADDPGELPLTCGDCPISPCRAPGATLPRLMGFAGVVIVLAFSTQTTLEGFTLLRGAYGLVINESQEGRYQNRSRTIFLVVINLADGSAEISQNIVKSNGEFGIGLGANAMATIRENFISIVSTALVSP